MKKTVSVDGNWFYVDEISASNLLNGGWLSVTGEPVQNGLTWLPFATWKVKAKRENEVATDDDIARYAAHFPGWKPEEPEFMVENHRGGFGGIYLKAEALDLAKEQSVENSSVFWVRHSRAYTPEAIYFSGRCYRSTESE